MKIFRNILLIALVILVQSTIIGRVEIYGVRPDFVMLLLIFLISCSSPVESILYAFFIGFLQDVYTPEFLGYNAFVLSLTAFLLDTVTERLRFENISVKITAIFGACLFHDIIYSLFYTKFDVPIVTTLFVEQIFPGAVYTTLIALIFIGIWKWAVNGGLFIVIRELMGFDR